MDAKRRSQIVLALLTVMILVGALIPGTRPPRNALEWRGPTEGLRFEARSQLVAEMPLGLASAETTLEVWVRPDAKHGEGNLEIVSFLQGPNEHGLLLGQFPLGLYYHRCVDPDWDKERDLYARIPRASTWTHLAVVTQPSGTQIYQQGRPLLQPKPEWSVRSDLSGGWLVLGNTRGRGPGWRGSIMAVALHDRALNTSELESRSQIPIPQLRDRLISGGSGVRLLHIFDRAPSAGRYVSLVADGADFRIPDTVSPPSPSVLRWFRPLRSDMRWFSIDVGMNVLAFMPLGFLLVLLLPRLRLFLATLLGFLLSLSIELTQVLIPGRDSSLIDLCTNTTGAFLGASIALVVGILWKR